MSKAPKPTITRRERSRLIAEAGAAAYEGAGTAPDERAAKALLSVGTAVDIAGLTVRPLTLEIFLVMEEVWRTKAHEAATGSLKQAMTLYAYCRPDQAKALLHDEKALTTAVRDFASSLLITDLQQLTKLVGGHLADFYGVPAQAETAKKKETAKATAPSKTGRKA